MPRSLVSVPDALRLALAVGAALTMLEMLMLCEGRGDEWIPVILFALPMVTWFFVGDALARRLRRRAALIGAIGVAVHFAIIYTIGARFDLVSRDAAPLALYCVALMVGMVGVAEAPALVAGALLASKRDLEAGDVMMGVGGAWLALLQGAGLAFIGKPTQGARNTVLVLYVGCALGVVVLGAIVHRAVHRRHWCARVARGEVHGFRVRMPTSPEELAALPPVFGSPQQVTAVIERVALGGGLYRGGLIGEPVAAVRVTP